MHRRKKARLHSSNTYLQKKKQNVTSQIKSVNNALKDFHDRCIITPIANANSNVALIRKRFYALTLFKEFGVMNSSQPAITCLKLTIETLEQEVKYVHV